MGWLERLRNGLKRTRTGLTESVSHILSRGKFGPEELEALEEALIAADVGARVAAALVEELRDKARQAGKNADLLALLQEEIKGRLAGAEREIELRHDSEPTVILVAGVNGSGKTTTIAKIAARLRAQDSHIPITFAAADTFRAAAIEQL